MTRRILLSGGVLSLLLLLVFQPGAAQDNTQLFDGMNIIFAVDVSGSMYESVNTANRDQVDRGLRYVLDRMRGENDVALETEATDPNNLRFETINFMVQWLQSFALAQESRNRQMDVNVRVVTFNQNTEMETSWVNLNTFDPTNPDTGDDLTYRPPTSITEASNSDFITLYDALRNMESPPSGNNKNILVIVTDSLPCNPPDINVPGIVNGVEVREVSCANWTQMEAHINNLNAKALPDYAQYLYLIPPTDGKPERFDQVREVYARFDDEWENQINKAPRYLTLDALPSDLFNTVVLEIGNVLGVGNANTDQVFAELGLNPLSQTFEVPPYLTSMEMLVFLPTGETAGLPIFRQGEDEMNYTIVDTKANGVLNWIRFERPRPGTWELDTTAESFNAWATFLPAQATLSFRADEGNIYNPFEIQYQVLDQDGSPLPIQEDYPLIFDIELVGTEGRFEITDFEAFGTAYIAHFATLTAGNYTISGNVRPADSTWVETANIDVSFLAPPDTDTINIKDAIWTPTFGSEAQQAATQNGVLSMSRRNEVEVSLQLLQGTNATPIPNNATATLIFEPPPEAQNACPDPSKIAMSPAQTTRLTSTIRFPEGGKCIIYLEISLADDDFLPLETTTTIVYHKNEIGRVDVSTTSRVTVVLTDAANNDVPIENDPASLNFEMADYVGSPQIGENGSILSWQRDETTIRLLMKDEDGNPVDPEYEGFQTITQNEDEATQDDAIIVDAPVPFQVRITQTNSDQNIATDKAIKVVKSAQVGYYLLNIHDLNPGDYVVEIILNTAEPALRSDFEYASSVLAGVRPGAQPTFRANLHVTENQTVVRLNQILIGIGIFAGVFLTYRVERVWRIKRAPLKGTIGIYKRIGDNPSTPLEEVFVETLPHKITYEVPPSRLPQFPLALDKMVVTTRASRKTSREGGAWVTIVKDDQELAPKYLESGQMPEEGAFHIDPLDSTSYYLIKDRSDSDAGL